MDIPITQKIFASLSHLIKSNIVKHCNLCSFDASKNLIAVLIYKKKKVGAGGHEAMHRGGQGVRVEGRAGTKACAEEVAQGGGASSSQASGAPEAFEGSAAPPPAACAPDLCSDSGHDSQRGGLSPASLATSYHPPAQSLAGRDNLPWQSPLHAASCSSPCSALFPAPPSLSPPSSCSSGRVFPIQDSSSKQRGALDRLRSPHEALKEGGGGGALL